MRAIPAHWENSVLRSGRAGRARIVAVMPSSVRISEKARACTHCDEYSGTALVHVHGQTIRFHPSDGLLISAEEANWAYNDGEEPAEVVWLLVRRYR